MPQAVASAQGIRGVLFDVGDTLVHFAPVSRMRYLETAAEPAYRKITEWGYPLPAYPRYLQGLKWTLARAFIWARLRRREVAILPAFEHCHRRMGVRMEPAQLAQLRRESIDALRAMMSVDVECHRVIEALHTSGYQLGLVSNTLFPGASIDQFLESEGLLRYFPVRIYSSEVHYRKPHRRIFEAALVEMGTPADQILFVGDRLDNDVAGPARVGMKTALVLHAGAAAPGRVRPDHIVRRLTDLLDILSR
jgi:HAD superfamily hydrolase (TIGR01549 family)